MSSGNKHHAQKNIHSHKNVGLKMIINRTFSHLESWVCNFDEYKCEGSNRCLPILWKCDGKAQCPDGTDERGCDHGSCANDQFHCSEQNTCIPASWRCDGASDCLSGDDEKLCGKP